MAQGHLFGKELVAVVIEAFDGVVVKVDGQRAEWQSAVGGVFEVLQYAEAIDTLGAGTNEMCAGAVVLA